LDVLSKGRVLEGVPIRKPLTSLPKSMADKGSSMGVDADGKREGERPWSATELAEALDLSRRKITDHIEEADLHRRHDD
jgi:hypothetical protein